MLPLLATILGIGLVLFIHETGHYVAARMAGVRVEVFSIGMGPRIFGWKWRGCDFRISLVPFGAYVRMAGEEMTREALPDELGAQPPRWRFFIFAGGILMNFLFALLLIPALFRIGVPFYAPVAGQIEAGGPAWQAGMEQGDRILSVNGKPTYGFLNFMSTVALSEAGQPLNLEVEGREGSRRSLVLEPKYDKVQGFRRAGVNPPLESRLELQVEEESPAWEAGLRQGDQLISLEGVALETAFEADHMLAFGLLSGTPIRLGLESPEGDTREVVLHPQLLPEAPPAVGIHLWQNRVEEIRSGPLKGHLQEGDWILEAGDQPVARRDQLLAACLIAGGLPPLKIFRQGQEILLPARSDIDARQVASDLWLKSHEELRVGVTPGGPAALAGFRHGDQILRVDDRIVHELVEVAKIVRSKEEEEVRFTLLHPGEEEPVQITVQPKSSPRIDLPVNLFYREEIVRRDNMVDALWLGLSEANRMVHEVFLTLNRMITGQVDRKNIGGILTIGQVTYQRANKGLVPLLFFLAMISIHLGVLNLLPIPALDGGHLLFVIIEKLRGRPLSERTQGWFNLVGVVAVLGLILFTLWQDIRRLME
ncbi:MAG: RIP metalloprotease RseP [Planctomycetota bacterium]|nr:MAG: RIP metalloprotease RseP [Planctomycetota bacterium]